MFRSIKESNYRSSHQRCSIKKGVLRNFTKFKGKHLSQSLFFNKVAGLRPVLQNIYLNPPKIRPYCPILYFLRTPFLQNTSGRVLLQLLLLIKIFGALSNNSRNLNTSCRNVYTVSTLFLLNKDFYDILHVLKKQKYNLKELQIQLLVKKKEQEEFLRRLIEKLGANVFVISLWDKIVFKPYCKYRLGYEMYQK